MKKTAFAFVAFVLVALGLCVHVDPATGAWGFAIPGTGPSAADLDEELHELLGYEDSVDVLARTQDLVRRGASLEARNGAGMQAMHLAADSGHCEACAWMLDEGAAIDARSDDGLQPLHEAAGGGHLDVVQLLLGRGADPNAKTRYGSQVMHYAAMSDVPEVVACLIAAGADVDNPDQDGWTPYKQADDERVRKLLVDAGAKRPPPTAYERNQLGKKLSQLWLTADGREDMRNQAIDLLSRGARGDITFEGVHPIHFWIEDAAIVRMLIENDASVTVPDEDGQPPLLLAVNGGHVETVKVLLAAGADPKKAGPSGVTPFEIASGEMLALLRGR